MGKQNKGECKFNPLWLDKEKFPAFHGWLCKVNDYHAGCTLCDRSLCKPIKLQIMGVSALYSHMSSKKQQQLTAASSKNNLNQYLIKSRNKNENKESQQTAQSKNTDVHQVMEPSLQASQLPDTCAINHVQVNSLSINQIDVDNSNNLSTSFSSSKNGPNINTVRSYISNDDVAKAEIIYAFCQIKEQASLRCFADLSDCLPIMFYDSEIAKKFKMHKDKLSYVITYGLGPYIQKELAYVVKSCKFFAISFDESLNKIAQKEQMDLVVRYWNDKDQISTRYLTSCFIEGAKAEDILASFKKALLDLHLDLKKIIQISMDGPNVNLKFGRDFDDYLSNVERAQNDFNMIEIGSCALHKVNNSFKTGHNETDWNIDKFLRSLYYFFKNVPVRRATFSRITDSYQFPKKFCSIRWTENGAVMETAKLMVPNLKKYIMYVAKKPPSTKNFTIIKNYVDDVFLNAKLSFLISVSRKILIS